MDSPTYVDLNNGEQENMFFFLLNAYLTSRIETDCESDGDEEVNVYMAGLLHGVVDGKFYTETTDHLANDFETYHGVLDHMARHHLDLLPRLSRGQAFYLEHGAHEAALPAI
ncbi:MAG: hypothetical protein VX290_00265 [Candidatus Latescibacterota bacterium]|nr:hypothetical protein [Candidatus Latescibacterota bacterium]